MDLAGNYILDLRIGGIVVPVVPSMIEELTITQDCDRMLPVLKMKLKDSTGSPGEIIPYDKELNSVDIRISRGTSPDNLNEFNFRVKRRKATFERMYDIEGVLDVDGLISPYRKRALTGLVEDSLESLAITELGISETEISASLNYEKTLLQPNWNNLAFLRWLRYNLIGRNDESCFYCFIKNIRGIKVFVFKDISELSAAPVQHKLVVGYKYYEDFTPVVDYRIFDNSQLIADFGALSQSYSYYDYDSGEVVHPSISILDYPSLSELFLVDKDNVNESVTKKLYLGRSNSFTADFKGRMRNDYFDRLTGLIQMWVSTWGLENISPGDVVKVIFSEALDRAKLFVYEHSGYWMVKRVVHIIGSSFMTNLLLVRAGIDTTLSNSLTEATRVRRSD